jgi:uncharacterized membrane protein
MRERSVSCAPPPSVFLWHGVPLHLTRGVAAFNQRKLGSEVGKWVADGLIDSGQAKRILERYPKSGHNYWLIAFAAIGSLLMLTGISLLIASNWESIPALFKFVCLLLLLAGTMTLGIEAQRLGWHRAWWECSYLAAAVFPLLGLALISQIFHTDGKASLLFLAWAISIAALPWLTRSVSSLVMLLLAVMSVNACLLDEDFYDRWGTIRDFEALCFSYLAFGVLCAVLSQLWRRVNEPVLADVGEFWGLLIGFIAGYVYGFDGHPWFLIWFLVFAAAMGLIYFGYLRERVHQVNLGFVMVALVILSIFFRLVGTMMDTGLIFIIGGGVILVCVLGLNHVRRRLLRRMA